MSREEIQKLLGGYATDTLSEAERRALFEAAIEDQELFDALAKEQALRDVLHDPSARKTLILALAASTRCAGDGGRHGGFANRGRARAAPERARPTTCTAPCGTAERCCTQRSTAETVPTPCRACAKTIGDIGRASRPARVPARRVAAPACRRAGQRRPGGHSGSQASNAPSDANAGTELHCEERGAEPRQSCTLRGCQARCRVQSAAEGRRRRIRARALQHRVSRRRFGAPPGRAQRGRVHLSVPARRNRRLESRYKPARREGPTLRAAVNGRPAVGRTGPTGTSAGALAPRATHVRHPSDR